MNCEKCQDILSDYLDGALGREDHAAFSAHLEECFHCFSAHDELNAIVSFCRENRGEYVAPPNERALWLRIRNTVEAETQAAAARSSLPAEGREGWWSRMMGRSWELSLPQVAMAVVAIIVVASLATIFGLRGLQKVSTGEGIVASKDMNGRGAAGTLAVAGPNNADANNRHWQQQQIKYWSQVVEERKGHWSQQVRQDFEHNLKLLDETVEESLKKLSEQPHDEVTEEMLNAALSDKMQLLKEFSDL
ncbi:MAG TPA: zf-HC2 domain-containing protein [Pyrinomonadaceae bacterium]|nr:zf-HC2 domain-containing protein [Pyrinomonadaceae bacterium]